MKKIYSLLQEFWELIAFIILICVFGLNHAIGYALGWIVGGFICEATKAFKRYKPTQIFIDNAEIELIEGADFKINNGTMNIPTANITQK